MLSPSSVMISAPTEGSGVGVPPLLVVAKVFWALFVGDLVAVGAVLEPVAVEVMETVEVKCPVNCLFTGGDVGQLVAEAKECFVRGQCWLACGVFDGVASHVDEAALDRGVWPALFEGFVCATGAVCGDDDGFGDQVEEFGVVIGGFSCAPVPGDDVIAGCGDKQAFFVEVGAVYKELVVDAVRVWFARDDDEPEEGKPADKCAPGDVVGCSDGIEGALAGNPVDEDGKPICVGLCHVGVGEGVSAVCAAPSLCSAGGGAHFCGGVLACRAQRSVVFSLSVLSWHAGWFNSLCL